MGDHHSFPWIVPLTFDTCFIMLSVKQGGARGVMVISVGNGHGDMSSKPG